MIIINAWNYHNDLSHICEIIRARNCIMEVKFSHSFAIIYVVDVHGFWRVEGGGGRWRKEPPQQWGVRVPLCQCAHSSYTKTFAWLNICRQRRISQHRTRIYLYIVQCTCIGAKWDCVFMHQPIRHISKYFVFGLRCGAVRASNAKFMCRHYSDTYRCNMEHSQFPCTECRALQRKSVIYKL